MINVWCRWKTTPKLLHTHTCLQTVSSMGKLTVAHCVFTFRVRRAIVENRLLLVFILNDIQRDESEREREWWKWERISFLMTFTNSNTIRFTLLSLCAMINQRYTRACLCLGVRACAGLSAHMCHMRDCLTSTKKSRKKPEDENVEKTYKK